MKVNHVLILAAGKGTRMGEIGKTLPKVIWPVFGKSLLELEVEYAKKLAPGAKVYINLYNYKDEILSFVKANPTSFFGVEFIEEEAILDIGGAVHNLSSRLKYKGNLLILNSDQFLFCNESVIKSGLEKLERLDSLLYTYTVNSKDGYNAINIQDEMFTGVIMNREFSAPTEIETYTGMSLIKLDGLKPLSGESKFFESVANCDESKVGISKVKEFEYWDFGTTNRYHESIFKLIQSKKSSFYKFLDELRVFENVEIEGDAFIFKDFTITKDKIRYKSIENIIKP